MKFVHMNPANEYLTKKIEWEESGDSEYPFCAIINNKRLVLRLNDFPEEPMYTLLVNNQEVIDLDGVPSTWQIPRYRGKLKN